MTDRSVNTVGPASIASPSTAIVRSLPPGPGCASTTVTVRPCAASSAALTSPPTPAPITTTPASDTGILQLTRC